MRGHFKSPSSGSVLLPLIIVLPFLMLIATYYMNLSISSLRLAHQDRLHTSSQLGADAGADYALEQINQASDWSGTNGEVELLNQSDSRTTYEVSVTNNSPSSKTLTAIGRSYRPAGVSSPTTSVTIKVDLRPVESGTYSVVSGQGGLIMSNSSKITGGDVFINGEITMSNSAQIGLSTNPVNISVANQICPIPADATYPRLCNSGENNNPIAINNSAHIYGNVKANHQSSGSSMSNPGLVASSGVVPAPLPSHDRDAQKAAVTTTITGSTASCSGSQIKSWAGNSKITGTVNLSNSCQVTINGNVWISGNFYISNSAKMLVADSVGTTRPVIMVDGSSGAIFSNSAKLISNASGTGAEIITYWSKASCSPDCADVTGTDLNDSRDETTISISDSAEGAQSIFYARWTQLNLANSGQIGAVVGQTIQMSNTATVTFGTAIGGSSTSGWVIDGYRRSF
ncbi:hypothetical protein HYW35_02015 [Candidatus Saccharibacteria bacterium]|nr:hypothetical protein [Candidatus Saccharibacteria bacterium]